MDMTIEEKLKSLIIEKYGTVSSFTSSVGMPNSTFATIMKKGIHNASIQSVIKICKELDISADELANDRIVFNDHKDIREVSNLVSIMRMNISTYDLTLDGKPLSEAENEALMDALELCVEFIRRQR